MADFFKTLGNVVSGETIGGAADKKILKKVNPVLTSNEKRRITNESTIAAEAFFNVQRKNQKDTFGETERPSTPAGMAEQSIQKTKEEKPKKLKFPLLLALGAGITAFAAWIADFIGPVAEFISKTLPKLLKPMGKLAGGFFKAIKGGKLMKVLGGLAKGIGGRLLKFGRFIPVIGSLFSFGFGIARWKKGEYIPAIFEFVSGILNLLPFGVTNIASLIIDGALLLYDLNKTEGEEKGVDPTGGSFDLWGKIKDFALSMPGIQNIVSLGKGIGAVLAGDWGEAAKHFMQAIPVVGSILFWLEKSGKIDMSDMGSKLGKAGDFFVSIKDKFVSIFTDIVDSIVGGLKTLGKKFSKIGSGFKAAFGALAPGGESPMEAFNRVVYADDFARFSDGTIVKFNKKDDILGAKPGGPLSNLLKGIVSRSGVGPEGKDFLMNKAQSLADTIIGVGRKASAISNEVFGPKIVVDKVVASEVKKSNNLLAQLVQLTAQNAANNNASPPPIIMQNSQNNEMPGSMEGPSYNDAKTNFLNSAYTMQPS